MTPDANFPRLNPHNHQLSSEPTTEYNCIAWSARDTTRWWQPGEYWPVDILADDFGIGVLIQAFQALGYETCVDDRLESGYEKVALYGAFHYYTHASRQLPSGKWTSKLGKAEDIEHDTPDDLAGGIYGSVVEFMKRPILKGV